MIQVCSGLFFVWVAMKRTQQSPACCLLGFSRAVYLGAMSGKTLNFQSNFRVEFGSHFFSFLLRLLYFFLMTVNEQIRG